METRWWSELAGSSLVEVRGDALWATSGLFAVGAVTDETADGMFVTEETSWWYSSDLEPSNSLCKPKLVASGLLCSDAVYEANDSLPAGA